MSSEHVSENAVIRARKAAKLSPAELTLIRAGAALRNARGKLRGNYTRDEIEIVAKARRLLHEIGEKSTARRLVLRSGRNAPFVPIVDIHTAHNCPLCGRFHSELLPRARHRPKR